MYDVIIIGGGPAGLTAAIYASRRELKSFVITKEIGGQVATAPCAIENYPGFKKTSGMDLMEKIKDQVQDLGVPIDPDGVSEIIEKDGKFILNTDEEKTHEAKAVILAFGKSPRRLGIPGEDEFDGKGVSYCVNCDGPLFRGEVVCTIGGGNSALDAAIYMSEIGKKVYVIHRRDQFRGFEKFVNKLKKKDNVEFILDTVVKEFKGDKMLKSAILENTKTGETRELEVAGAFIECGSEVKSDFVKDLVKLDEKKHIVINERCQAYYPDSNEIRPGVFGAGDVTNTPFKQIVVATGHGAIATLQAYNYIKGVEGQAYVDWGHKREK